MHLIMSHSQFSNHFAASNLISLYVSHIGLGSCAKARIVNIVLGYELSRVQYASIAYNVLEINILHLIKLMQYWHFNSVFLIKPIEGNFFATSPFWTDSYKLNH